MTMSEVFYEAACRMSDCDCSNFSCQAVDGVVVGKHGEYCDERRVYSALMTDNPISVEQAASEVGWSFREFRTFMLLMASEAVK
jgi:hypothetical protein